MSVITRATILIFISVGLILGALYIDWVASLMIMVAGGIASYGTKIVKEEQTPRFTPKKK